MYIIRNILFQVKAEAELYVLKYKYELVRRKTERTAHGDKPLPRESCKEDQRIGAPDILLGKWEKRMRLRYALNPCEYLLRFGGLLARKGAILRKTARIFSPFLVMNAECGIKAAHRRAFY